MSYLDCRHESERSDWAIEAPRANARVALPKGQVRQITVATVLDELRTALASAAIPNPGMEARLLLREAMGVNDAFIIAHPQTTISADALALVQTWLTRRLNHEPIAYITGSREFWGRDFAVSPATLIPRPDSETLIEAILHHRPDTQKPYQLLDLGTGTGCLLLTLLAEYPNAKGTGIEAISAAVALARRNARAHGLSSRAALHHCRWDYFQLAEAADIIIANPPYIPAADIATLASDVKDHEPMSALIGGADGLDAYRVIFSRTHAWLAGNGLLAVEIGQGQEADITAIAAANGFGLLEARRDLAGITRTLLFTL
ncbi:peptide chain release factor N(5)-glutamine methyltransferase [bacterium]|nr:peptide chain release factor N(5)-glutamine methyltransferase [bacterium]